MTEPRGSRRQRNAPTISDVAAHAGVSPMTVSRVINHETSVREATRIRVQEAIATLRYAPSPAARMLAGGDELRLGVLHTTTSLFYFSEFLVGCLDQASRQSAQIIVEQCAVGAELAAIDHLLNGGVDGLLLPPPLGDAEPVLAALRARDVPVVAVSTGRAPEWALSVSIDDRQAAYEMTRHLGALGHRRIGFITGAANQSASGERLAGYRDALTDFDLDADPALVAEGTFGYRSGLDAAERLLDLPDAPTAIFASNDDMAAATIAIAHRRALDVPGDLTVCGFDDSALATTVWPELTTIRQPVSDMARTAVDLLVRDIRQRRSGGSGGGDHPHVVTDYALIRRQSDAVPRRRPRPSS
ncbi:LacI family transcriptional regulator [Sphingomonas sp. Leaf231]|uniref:LacI family DNA-binding transcriptional regulator n=1 Tax=Sphingomonas sp. Leaf231 TaxID=1736301 RepID=UPI0006F5EBD3|nr:LacI family DNA-binding transcriptional regulator [Sphingomonas sp. Leaf231]KQN89719.1 LacI family transcriptional regulator [Sphingomonas sp. Leaf231]